MLDVRVVEENRCYHMRLIMDTDGQVFVEVEVRKGDWMAITKRMTMSQLTEWKALSMGEWTKANYMVQW